ERVRRLLGLKVKDLDDGPPRNPDPADPAGGPRHVDAEEAAHALRGRVGNAHERRAEDLPPEPHRAVEIRDGDAGMTERPSSHASAPWELGCGRWEFPMM